MSAQILPVTAAARPKWAWITLLVLQGLQVLSLIPWLLMAGFSFMAFDAPGSDKMWQPWAFVAAIWSYPLWLLLAAIAAWILFACRCPRSAVVVAAIFSLPALGISLFLTAGVLGLL
jgi:hypothetical protein